MKAPLPGEDVKKKTNGNVATGYNNKQNGKQRDLHKRSARTISRKMYLEYEAAKERRQRHHIYLTTPQF